MPKISICIPYHNMPNTAFYLSRALNSISEQTFKDYEIVLTDDGKFAENHNSAIKKAKGEIVQMLQMDDWFAHPESLEQIVKGFDDESVVWQITPSLHNLNGIIGHPHNPIWTDDIYNGNNRLGSVSTLSMRKNKVLLFEEPLTWVVDCDLYYRMFLKYGKPQISTDFSLIIDTRNDRLSSTISDTKKQEEINYLIKKYGK